MFVCICCSGADLDNAINNSRLFVRGRVRDVQVFDEGVSTELPNLQADIDFIACVIHGPQLALCCQDLCKSL